MRQSFIESLEKSKISENKNFEISNIDCIMSALSVFTFKFPSLLKFDESRVEDNAIIKNIKKLFLLERLPCDTYMRERLDPLDPALCRSAFRSLFVLLQRAKILENFRFFGDHYLVSVDGTGTYSSDSVHCSNCCVKELQGGGKTYYHGLLTAALVHPGQKVVFPFAPEAITKKDGKKKNDCERNAFKRWVPEFRREHPHMKTVIVADGLSSNEPLIRLLKEHNLRFILVCKEADHKALTEWVQAADPIDKPSLDTVDEKGVIRHYEYMHNVPLNDSNPDCLVTVVRFTETTPERPKRGKDKVKKVWEEKTTRWMWVTDLPVDLSNIEEFVKGGRSRWKIENETFNTLKNQGYNFEHNFGHGKKHLHTMFSHLMLLAFLIDQCLQQVNKRFQEALAKSGGKRGLWENIRSCFKHFELPDFESLYHYIVHPPPWMSLPSAVQTKK